MRRRPRLPWLLVWLVLFFLSLRPVSVVGTLSDLATSPLRIVAELASPISLLVAGRVSAAERALRDQAEEGADASVRLLHDLAESSLPTEPRLLRGRRAVHADVIGHRDWDHLLVHLRDTHGVLPGMPVAFGNAFVGRIERLAHGGEDPSLAVVTLVTASRLRVGAIIEEPERREDAGAAGSGNSAPPSSSGPAVRLSVGGIRTGPRHRGRGPVSVHGLAVYYPSDRSVVGGLVRVKELFEDETRYPELSEGLHLGRLAREDGHAFVQPEIDYKDGLFHVVVLAPRDDSLGVPAPFDAVLFDSHWVRARPINLGDPHPERSSRKIRVGRTRGVAAGAAVTSIGAHLVGRVVRAGLTSSDVALLDDPGFRVVAVARIEGIEEPKVLGRLIAIGRDGVGEDFLFRWVVRIRLTPGELLAGSVAPAQLFTGSGEQGLPAGFSIGATELPLDASPGQERIIRVRPDIDPADVGTFYVRTQAVAASAEVGP